MKISEAKENELQPEDSLLKSNPMEAEFSRIVSELSPDEGVVVITLGMKPGIGVHLLKPGLLTEAGVERNLPFIFQAIMRQRYAAAQRGQANVGNPKPHNPDDDGDPQVE